VPGIDLVSIGIVRELGTGDVIVSLAAEPGLASFGELDDAVLEAQMFLSEHLATAEPEVVARFALPEAASLHFHSILVDRDDLPRRFNLTTPIRFASLVIPTVPNPKGIRDRWVVILALQHTFYVRAEDDLDKAIESEAKRIIAARELKPLEWLDLLPTRREYNLRLDTNVTRQGGASIVSGANRQKRIAELEAKRHAVAVLDSVADPLHGGMALGRIDPAPFPLRDAEIENLRTLLAGTERASILVIGKERVGKTGLIRAWLEREHEVNRPRIVYQTSGARLIAGMSGFGQWQERVRRVMEAAALIDAIIYFDDLADLFADRPGGHVDIPSALRPFVEDNRVRVLGEIREELLDRVENQNGGFFACFGRVRLEPLQADDAKTILNLLSKKQIEKDPDRVALTEKGNAALVELAGRYLPYESFPGKAVRLAREIIAAHEIALGSSAAGARIGPEHVHEAFSVRTGVPTFLLRDEASLKVEDVIGELQKRLVGQEEAVKRVAELVCIVKAGLQPAGKPLATLLFVGPTGVGKTELARALATLLFGSEERLVRFDMSEYASAYATERLFRGNDGGEGLLTRKVREQPFSVILLDEIEKAHPAAFDLLLQVCGEGRLTDGRGKTAYFHNAILIMTSNLGATHKRAAAGFGGAGHKSTDDAHYNKVVRETFRPEFVNRIDRVVAFRSLDAEDIQAVAAIATARAGRRRGIVERGIDLAVSAEATAHLAATGMSEVYGARALRRHVERELVTPIARLISAKGGIEGERIVVAPSKTELAAGEEAAGEQNGLRFGIVHVPSRRSNNAVWALEQITAIRRRLHRNTRLSRVTQLRDQAAYLVAQLGHYALAQKKKKNRGENVPDGPEIAQMSADHARFAELLAALDGALAEIFAVEELALAAFVAGDPVDPLKRELVKPMKRFDESLVRILVAEEQKKNQVTLLVMELDDKRAFDLWLMPMLHAAIARKWTVNVHLDADKERAGVPWPADRRWGPPLAPDRALPRLGDRDRTFRNVVVTVDGDHARMWLSLESGTHIYKSFPGKNGDAALHIDVILDRANVNDHEWSHEKLQPPNAEAADALSKLPAVRRLESDSAKVNILGTTSVEVPFAQYWERIEEIALEHLLVYERNDTYDRDIQFQPLLNDRFAHIKDQLKKGNKIQAIKLFREITGVGLKDAKDAVEAME
jgi:ATP-dependent Clp protease ATP-binding subunit ClpC